MRVACSQTAPRRPFDSSPAEHPTTRRNRMADQDNMVLYSAVYDAVDDALSDLDAIEQLHKDSIIGKFDAAVIDQENGQPHIVKRMDRRRFSVINKAFARGPLRRKESPEAAGEC